MAIFNPIHAPKGYAPVAQPWGVGMCDPIPRVSSRLTSRWSPGPDGRQVWRWSVTDAAALKPSRL